MISSLIPFVAATLGAVGMALAFPRANAVVLAPLGALALFWAWFGASPKRAFWIGWVAGSVYFGIGFWWFGETAGALIAPFGFLIALGPAVADGFFGFALPGVLVAVAARGLSARERPVRAFAPLAAAAIFAAAEWFRSEGLGEIGVPFTSLGFTQVSSPLAALGAYVGTYGITFAVGAIGAYLAYALRLRNVRGSGVDAGIALGALACASLLAWTFWPARTLPAPAYRVAAIQGNIPQTLKFAPGALPQAIARYTALTRDAAATHPQLILWPETVIPVAFNTVPALRERFSELAKRVRAELVVGTYEVGGGREYNVLEFFRADGRLERTYRKRQLVPFAEHIPWRPAFAWIPWMSNVSNFSEGSRDEIVPVGEMRFGPVVCWESAFSGLANGETRDGAQVLLVATDDAWFGTSAGPYQHAQIAQMRAIETGRYVLRAASTGISGIVAPDGRYLETSRMNQTAIVSGAVGQPVETIFDGIGSAPIAALLALLYAAIVAYAAFAARREPRSPHAR
jgi:apolipoprotein N-acyltransferase